MTYIYFLNIVSLPFTKVKSIFLREKYRKYKGLITCNFGQEMVENCFAEKC